jgi:hypothetical protein
MCLLEFAGISMRRLFAFLCLAGLSGVGVLFACSAEEAPNPPATRNGSESTTSGGPGSLPPPSTTATATATATATSTGSTKKDSGPPAAKPTSGLTATKELSQLSTTERRDLCEWQASVNGGYARKTTCDGGFSVESPSDLAECLQQFPSTCDATIAETEACIKKDAADPCAVAFLNSPECKPLRDCLNPPADAGPDGDAQPVNDE